MTVRRILVTAALPYANGHIHIGHLLEYIQTDVWVRFQKLRGHDCRYFCADDTHGTAIMLRARQEGRSEEALIADMREAHLRDFAAFDVEFDHYGSTHSPQNRELCGRIWRAIRAAGLVKERHVEQLYDPQARTFLADRFVRGTCPVCKAPDQPGDNCAKCGAHYTPTELIDPRSTLSGAVPEVRAAPHLFIELEQLHNFLAEWTQSGEHLQPEIANYLQGHFLGEPLKDWDVSRPAPYFGFEIPDSPGNYWYVWFDAPIGYIASTWEWCQRTGQDLSTWWPSQSPATAFQSPATASQSPATASQSPATASQSPATASPGPVEIHHFIGKDITYFHTLFWPGMLQTAGFQLPTKVHVHGFLTVDGEKMSKSKGTFIQASTYAAHLDPAYLRYFFASKLGPRVDDIDLNFTEFKTKVDSDLVGKVVNIASRCAKFISGESLSRRYPDDGGLFRQGAEAGENIAAHYETCDFNAAMREVMLLADRANQYIETREPWKLRKDPARTEELRDVCTVGLNLFRQIAVYLAPVLPRLARQTGELLNAPLQHWSDAQSPLVGSLVGQFRHMLTRVDPHKVQAMIEESREPGTQSPEFPAAGAQINDGPEALEKEPLISEPCTIEDFARIDLRVARVLAAEHVAGADKLLKLTLSLGGDVRRTVFAGIKSCYQPEQLIGRLVICCANLVPRKMRFGVSEGMVLACGPGGQEIFLLNPDAGALPGMRVH